MRWGILFVFFSILISSQRSDIDTIRKNYQKAVSDKRLCKQMIEKFENSDNLGINLAYFGAFQALWAKHANNPFEKLRYFKSGKRNIEKAINQQPDHLESRFIRYSVQKSAPGFLGYKNNTEEDKAFLKNRISEVSNPILKDMLIQILKN